MTGEGVTAEMIRNPPDEGIAYQPDSRLWAFRKPLNNQILTSSLGMRLDSSNSGGDSYAPYGELFIGQRTANGESDGEPEVFGLPQEVLDIFITDGAVSIESARAGSQLIVECFEQLRKNTFYESDTDDKLIDRLAVYIRSEIAERAIWDEVRRRH